MQRRDFLRSGAVLALPALDPLLRLLPRTAILPGGPERVLVLLELAGGNDGLNTVVPVEDPVYHAARPMLRVRGRTHPLGRGLALHPSMGGMSGLFGEGWLAVVSGVGYPEPNRSHFRSMDIWQSARPDLAKPQRGWLGLAADELATRGSEVPAMSLGATEIPLCLHARRIVVPALRSLREYQLFQDGRAGGRNRARKETLLELVGESGQDDELARRLKRVARQAYEGSEKLRKAVLAYRPLVEYPNTGLGRRFELAARALSSPLGTRIVHLRQTGYDTHASQDRTHATLLGELSDALGAFAKDFRSKGFWDRTLVFCFSEFGRRVAENQSRGTDHGTAAPVFLAGGSLAGGLFGEQPSLSDLDQGDLRFNLDFRRLYAEILERWLEVPAEKILNGRFPRVGVLG
ncbi:MAG: DUF1501 domain-containing protein [Planctomycetota bacterium]